MTSPPPQDAGRSPAQRAQRLLAAMTGARITGARITGARITGALLAGALMACGVVASAPAARAATVAVEGFTSTGTAVVRLSGRIVAGDAQKLLNATSTVHKAIVVLDSKGGMVGEGIRIGSIVRSRAFTTYVPAKAECASMCGVVWLSGRTRWLDAESKVGFHAAYNAQDKEVSGSANAVIGAFLQSIGLGLDAIGYVATASPRTVSWMTADRATRLGVSYAIAVPDQVAITDRKPVPGSLSPVAGQANANRFSCDLPTARLILDAMSKDRDARQAFLKDNSAVINRQCHGVAERASLVIETFHTELPMACIRRPGGAPCEWMQLADLTVTPDAPVPGVEALPAQTAVQSPVLDARRAFAGRVGVLGERDLCRTYLAGPQNKVEEPFDVVIAEAARRRLTAERCAGVVACADPAVVTRARGTNALACQDRLGTVGITELCAAALAPGSADWRDDPAFYWIRLEIRQRVVDVAACRKLLAPEPGSGTSASPLDTSEAPSLRSRRP